MEHKRDIDGAGISDPDDGHDTKRVCLPPLEGFDQFSSQYWDQASGDTPQSTGFSWMQPNDQFLPSDLDSFTFEEEINLEQLLACDIDFEQISASSINPQQLTDSSVTINSTPRSPLVIPSPPPIIEDS